MTVISTYLRVKPNLERDESCIQSYTDNKVIVWDEHSESSYTFAFTKVLSQEANQRQVFDNVARKLVDDTIDSGENTMLFTLGASGSGKSHTLFGPALESSSGIISLALERVFDKLSGQLVDLHTLKAKGLSKEDLKRNFYCDSSDIGLPAMDTSCSPEGRYGVFMSMVEIYNDKIFDLNAPITKTINTESLGLRRDHKGEGKSSDTWLSVDKMRKIYVPTPEIACKVLENARTRRSIHSTKTNQSSSRSHVLVTMEIIRLLKDSKESHRSRFQIADLAGSERNKDADLINQNSRLAESCSINRSLMQLGQCLQQLKKMKANDKVNSSLFRSCKLTQLLLSNSFLSSSGQKCAVLVTLDPSADYATAGQIMKYAGLVKTLEIPMGKEGPNYKLLLEETIKERDEIEDRIRAEMAEEMDRRFEKLRISYFNSTADMIDKEQEHADTKITFMGEMIAEKDSQLEQLKNENHELKKRIAELESRPRGLRDSPNAAMNSMNRFKTIGPASVSPNRKQHPSHIITTCSPTSKKTTFKKKRRLRTTAPIPADISN